MQLELLHIHGLTDSPIQIPTILEIFWERSATGGSVRHMQVSDGAINI